MDLPSKYPVPSQKPLKVEEGSRREGQGDAMWEDPIIASFEHGEKRQ